MQLASLLGTQLGSDSRGTPYCAFRHTQASQLIASGTDIVSVSKRLGHADTTTTINIYAHELEKAEKKSATVIGQLYYREG